MNAHLRVARPTNDMKEAIKFYKDGLGFEIVSSFENHDGFSGVMFANPGMNYHIEVTEQTGHKVNIKTTLDDLLVFYLPDRNEWSRYVKQVKKLGYSPVKSYNPYWDKKGITFEDQDGYRVVLQNAYTNIK